MGGKASIYIQIKIRVLLKENANKSHCIF